VSDGSYLFHSFLVRGKITLESLVTLLHCLQHQQHIAIEQLLRTFAVPHQSIKQSTKIQNAHKIT